MSDLRSCIIILNLFVPCLTDSVGEAFNFASQLHQDICVQPNGTTVGPRHNNDSCCGFCMNDRDCQLHGSCCLGIHDNFNEAKRSIVSTR